MKEEGIENPEDHVLTQYAMPDPTKPPMPIAYDDSLAAGVLMLYPESELEEEGVLPTTGGVVGTVKSIFRALGFGSVAKPQIVAPEGNESEPESKQIARAKRGTGLYGKRNAKGN